MAAPTWAVVRPAERRRRRKEQRSEQPVGQPGCHVSTITVSHGYAASCHVAGQRSHWQRSRWRVSARAARGRNGVHGRQQRAWRVALQHAGDGWLYYGAAGFITAPRDVAAAVAGRWAWGWCAWPAAAIKTTPAALQLRQSRGDISQPGGAIVALVTSTFSGLRSSEVTEV